MELRKVAPIKMKKAQQKKVKMSKKVKNLLDEGLESEQLESLKKKEERLSRLNKESTVIPVKS